MSKTDLPSWKRLLIYLIGICILALGITLNTKTDLGVSPVMSVAYNLSSLCHIPFGIGSFLYYCLMILLQFIILRDRFKALQLFQLPVSFLTSLFIDLFDRILLVPSSLLMKCVFLLLAIIALGTGIVMTVGCELFPNPAEGVAAAIAERSGKSLGFSKNLLDFTCLFISSAIALIFSGNLLGVGWGSLITMLLTGRSVSFLRQPLMSIIYKILPGELSSENMK